MQGIVRNNFRETLDLVVVRGNAYDEEGSLIGTGTYEIKEFGRGEKAAFHITIESETGDLAHIRWHCSAQAQ